MEDSPDDLQTFWKIRQTASLRRAKDRAAAETLRDAIYRWSRSKKKWGPNAGSWITDMDIICWDSCPSLHEQAGIAGGWWVWRDGVVFIPMKEWVVRYQMWKRQERAQRELRITNRFFARDRKTRYYAWLDRKSAKGPTNLGKNA